MNLHKQIILTLAWITCFAWGRAAAAPVHVWEMQELTFTAKSSTPVYWFGSI